jgi:hypothetical protein
MASMLGVIAAWVRDGIDCFLCYDSVNRSVPGVCARIVG